MPGGRVHTTATLIGMVAVPAGMAIAGFPTSGIVPVACGYAASLFVHPDLDLNTRLSTKDPKKFIWRLLWYGYSRLIPHRGFWSHFPLIGTALRVIYLWIFVALLGLIMGFSSIPPQEAYKPFLWFFSGIAMSDIVHTGLDVLSTSYKKWRSRWKRKRR